MLFSKRSAKKELDAILAEVKINLANNYKSVAHDKRRLLGERVEALNSEGKLTEKDYHFYRAQYETFTEVMKDYHH